MYSEFSIIRTVLLYVLVHENQKSFYYTHRTISKFTEEKYTYCFYYTYWYDQSLMFLLYVLFKKSIYYTY